MNNFESTAEELADTELADVTGGMYPNYDWMNYDWRDAVIYSLP